ETEDAVDDLDVELRVTIGRVEAQGLDVSGTRFQDASQPEERRGPVIKSDRPSLPFRGLDPAAEFDESSVMLPDRRQSVAEVDRDLRGGRTPHLQIAISRSRAGGVVVASAPIARNPSARLFAVASPS